MIETVDSLRPYSSHNFLKSARIKVFGFILNEFHGNIKLIIYIDFRIKHFYWRKVQLKYVKSGFWERSNLNKHVLIHNPTLYVKYYQLRNVCDFKHMRVAATVISYRNHKFLKHFKDWLHISLQVYNNYPQNIRVLRKVIKKCQKTCTNLPTMNCTYYQCRRTWAGDRAFHVLHQLIYQKFYYLHHCLCSKEHTAC